MWEESDAGADGMVRTLFLAVMCSYVCWPVQSGRGVEFFSGTDSFDRGRCMTVCRVSTSLLCIYPHDLTVWLWIWLVDLWKCSRWPTSRPNRIVPEPTKLFIYLLCWEGFQVFFGSPDLEGSRFCKPTWHVEIELLQHTLLFRIGQQPPNGWWVGRWSSRKSHWTALLCSETRSKTSGSSGNTPV